MIELREEENEFCNVSNFFNLGSVLMVVFLLLEIWILNFFFLDNEWIDVFCGLFLLLFVFLLGFVFVFWVFLLLFNIFWMFKGLKW